ncbi:MAG: hypothetical protein A2507_04180 [Candidatus Magasanikbacteria bacterium RIFOXYD12_FULL_33_17]|nr:MAG: hypothetical protein A2507_04180 [Candidatus Magasanikbacteria bacterium RIFOXYD12_FULL_33_17]
MGMFPGAQNYEENLLEGSISFEFVIAEGEYHEVKFSRNVQLMMYEHLGTSSLRWLTGSRILDPRTSEVALLKPMAYVIYTIEGVNF